MAGADEQLDVDVLAASLRADLADLDRFVEVLADKLLEALPARTKVDRRRGGLMGPKKVWRIVVALDDGRLELDCADDGLRTEWTRVSGGIALKHERLEVDAWLERLSVALASEAARSERTRQALERLLM